MIFLEKRKSEKLKNEVESIFISFSFNPDYLSRVKSLPVKWYIPESKEWEIPARHFNELAKAFKGIRYSTKGFDIKPNIDLSKMKFKTEPRKYQLDGVRYGLNKSHFLLGDEQGLGKTKQAIDIAVYRKYNEGLKRCLVIVGVNGIKYNWLKEIEKHSDEKGFVLGSRFRRDGSFKDGSTADKLADLEGLKNRDEFFLITNIESVRSKKKKTDKRGRKIPFKNQVEESKILIKLQELIESKEIGMIILDEIHKAKNPFSQQGEGIQALNTPYKIGMTGTVLMNNPLDLYNVFKWLGYEANSFYAFRNRYCNMGGYGGYEIVGYKNLGELQKKLSMIQLRRLKKDVEDLPEKIRMIEYVEMSEKQWQLYREIKAYIEHNLDDIILFPNPLSQLTRLRQVTGNPAIISDTIKNSIKLDRMEEIVEDVISNGGKVLIYSIWAEMVKSAADRLKKYNPAIIYGEVTAANRQEQADKFQEDPDCKIMIGTVGAMGTGLTLTAANTVIFLDKPWNPANIEQAEDRAHRIGTTETVTVITLVAKDTIDERIEELLDAKDDLFQGLVNGKIDKLSRAKVIKMLIK
jgi:SNF2 family DNA or RNA helicase